ncbi:MAG TPA: NHL repeat-containing protein [Chloroflexota bacterium]
MKRFWLIAMALFIVATGIGAPRSHAVFASGRAYAPTEKKICKTVSKIVHGTKKRVKVCHTVTSSRFTWLDGATVDTRGNVYVADRAAKRIVKLSPSGQTLARWLVPPDPKVPNSSELTGIAVDKQGSIYVADCRGYRIVKLSPAGKPVFIWYAPNRNTDGKGCGLMGIALDAQGNMYTTAFFSSLVGKISPAGRLLATFGKECPHSRGHVACASQDHNPPQPIPPGQLNHPVGVVVDNKGNMYVNDHRDSRIVKYSPSGKQLAVFGPQLPSLYPTLDYPEGVGIDGAGNIFVADPSIEMLIKLSPSGVPLHQWQAPPGFGPVGTPGYDAHGNLYVTVSHDWDGHSAVRAPAMLVKLSPGLKVLATWR